MRSSEGVCAAPDPLVCPRADAASPGGCKLRAVRFCCTWEASVRTNIYIYYGTCTFLSTLKITASAPTLPPPSNPQAVWQCVVSEAILQKVLQPPPVLLGCPPLGSSCSAGHLSSPQRGPWTTCWPCKQATVKDDPWVKPLDDLQGNDHNVMRHTRKNGTPKSCPSFWPTETKRIVNYCWHFSAFKFAVTFSTAINNQHTLKLI